MSDDRKPRRRARGTGEIFQVGAVWKIRYSINGRRVKETAGPHKRDAVALLAERLGQKVAGRLHPEASGFGWSALERIILDEHEQHRSYEKVERHVRRHLRRHFERERRAPGTYDRLLTYKQERLAEGAFPSTVRYELSLIRTGLVVAHKAGRVPQIPPMPSVKVENVRTGFFERAELDALLDELPVRVAPIVTFMYWTGWRRNEVLTRAWRHVDLERQEIRLEPGETKSGKGRALPYGAVPELVDVLEAQRRYTHVVQQRTGQVVPWVFHRNGKRVKSIRHAWRLACERAGLDGRIPHDLRRTAVRNLVRAGVPEKVAMEVTGHLTRSVFERYNIVTSGDVRVALAQTAAAKGPVKAHLTPLRRRKAP